MAPLVVDSCSGSFVDPPVIGDGGGPPLPLSPGLAALRVRRGGLCPRRGAVNRRSAPLCNNIRDDKSYKSLLLQLRAELEQEICNTSNNKPQQNLLHTQQNSLQQQHNSNNTSSLPPSVTVISPATSSSTSKITSDSESCMSNNSCQLIAIATPDSATNIKSNSAAVVKSHVDISECTNNATTNNSDTEHHQSAVFGAPTETDAPVIGNATLSCESSNTLTEPNIKVQTISGVDHHHNNDNSGSDYDDNDTDSDNSSDDDEEGEGRILRPISSFYEITDGGVLAPRNCQHEDCSCATKIKTPLVGKFSTVCSHSYVPAASVVSSKHDKCSIHSYNGQCTVAATRRPLDTPHFPPPKRLCSFNGDRINCNEINVPKSQCSHLRSPLTCPSSPLSSSLSSSMPFSSNFLCHTVLSPSANKLPLATIYKTPPPPAPPLVQPKPSSNVFRNSQFLPTSNNSLFERIYYRSLRKDSSPLKDSKLSSRFQSPLQVSSQNYTSNKLPPPPSFNNIEQKTFTPPPESHLFDDVELPNSTTLQALLNQQIRPLKLLPASVPSMPSLVSLLASTVHHNQEISHDDAEDIPPANLPCDLENQSKLPEFKDSFTSSSACCSTHEDPSSPSSGNCGSNESSCLPPNSAQKKNVDSNNSGKIHIPFDGKMCPLPFVGKIPQFTMNFLRTLTILLCKHCRQDPQTEAVSGVRCRRCHGQPLYSLFVGFQDNENSPRNAKEFPPTSLHVACLLSNPSPIVEKLLQGGLPPNYPNLLGQTPLHALLLGDIHGAGLQQSLLTLLKGGASPRARDNAGETPLLYVKVLLKEELYDTAVAVTQMLLNAGACVDDANDKGRTLLSYSLCCGDAALPLTRLLLNHGANTWGNPDHDWDHSAFLYLFKTAMLSCNLTPLMGSLHLICRLMSRQPRRMKEHLQRNMTRHGRYYAVYSGLSTQLLRVMEPYYKQPQSLTSLASLGVREALPSLGNKAQILNRLTLPKKIKKQILLEEEFC